MAIGQDVVVNGGFEWAGGFLPPEFQAAGGIAFTAQFGPILPGQAPTHRQKNAREIYGEATRTVV